MHDFVETQTSRDPANVSLFLEQAIKSMTAFPSLSYLSTLVSVFSAIDFGEMRRDFYKCRGNMYL